jgi:hypothetical protein
VCVCVCVCVCGCVCGMSHMHSFLRTFLLAWILHAGIHRIHSKLNVYVCTCAFVNPREQAGGRDMKKVRDNTQRCRCTKLPAERPTPLHGPKNKILVIMINGCMCCEWVCGRVWIFKCPLLISSKYIVHSLCTKRVHFCTKRAHRPLLITSHWISKHLSSSTRAQTVPFFTDCGEALKRGGKKNVYKAQECLINLS